MLNYFLLHLKNQIAVIFQEYRAEEKYMPVFLIVVVSLSEQNFFQCIVLMSESGD